MTVAEGKQHTGSGEEAFDYSGGNESDAEADHSLKEVGGYGGDAGVQDLGGSLLGHLAAAGFQGRGDEAQSQTVIGEHFQSLCSVSTEESGIIEKPSCDKAVDPCYDKQQDTAQDGSRDQGCLQGLNGFLQHICPKQGG